MTLTPLPSYSKAWNRGFIILSALSLLLPLFFHFRHDYATFTQEWARILAGQNPWLQANGAATNNAYGPLFNVFAPLYGIYSHLPHLVFIFCWLALSRFTLNECAPQLNLRERAFLFLFLLVNPFFQASVVSYGHFDILVALLLTAMLMRLKKGDETRAGLYSGAAVLLKMYPVFLLPFFVIGEKKINWKYLFTSLITIAAGFFTAWLIWGNSVFAPFLFATGRQSTQLSIFRFLRSELSPVSNLDFLSPWLLFMTAGAVGLVHLFKRKDPLFAGILGFYCTFWFYRVGHFQFYTSLFFLIPLWVSNHRKLNPQAHAQTPTDTSTITRALFFPLLFVSLAVFLYVLTQGYKFQWQWVDCVISIPFFLVQAVCFTILFKALSKT